MVHEADPDTGQTVKTVDVEPADRRRFSLSDSEIHELSRQALIIEKHYQRPMDIEWGRDGTNEKLYILQARPETVQSRSGRTLQRFSLKNRAEILVSGRSIGQRIGAGVARVIKDAREMDRIQPGDVLVTDMTDRNW